MRPGGLDALGHVVRAGQLPAMTRLENSRPLRRAAALGHKASAGWSVPVGVSLVAVAAAAVATLTLRTSPQLEAGTILAPGQPVTFSDGSRVEALEGGSLRVLEREGHRTRLSLAGGGADFKVRHHEDTDFVVRAGPYDIQVTGTSFRAKWDPQAGLEVDLHEGQVVILGPELRRTLAPGDSFRSRQPAPATRAPDAVLQNPVKVQVDPEPPTARPSRPPKTPLPTWPALARAGQFDQALEEVSLLGEDRVVRRGRPRDLLRLADAARLRHRPALARAALLQVHERGSSDERAEAAFALGRVSEASGHHGAAATWFGRCLEEDPKGPLAASALARRMKAHHSAGDLPAAARDAATYLKRFPAGPAADTARRLQ